MLHKNPIEQFTIWYQDAVDHDRASADIVALATTGADGQPSVRNVLFRGMHDNGFCFYTNFGSRKAEQLHQNPRASMLFYWRAQDRQIRIEGEVQKLPTEVSEAYFHSRPRQSQIGAWASRQSQPLASRQNLLDLYQHFDQEFPTTVPLPDFWGGYAIQPHLFEFWTSGDWRLHHRYGYSLGEGQWARTLLAP